MSDFGQGGNFESLEDRDRREQAQAETAQVPVVDPPLRRRYDPQPPREDADRAVPGQATAPRAKWSRKRKIWVSVAVVLVASVAYGVTHPTPKKAAPAVAAATSPAVPAPTADAPTTQAAPATSAPAAAPVAAGGSYPDATAILTRLSAAGQACGDPQPIAHPTLSGATSMTDCTSPGGQSGDTVVVVFSAHADAVAYAAGAVAPGTVPDLGADEVVGADWTVNTVPGYGQLVQQALGGDITLSTGSPAPAAPAPAAPPAQTVTYACTGHAGDGVDIMYGAEGSSSEAHHLPFSHTDPLNAGAQYFAVQGQLSGSGSVTCTTTVDWTDDSGDAQTVTQTGTANGGYNIASAEVCGDFEGGWQTC